MDISNCHEDSDITGQNDCLVPVTVSVLLYFWNIVKDANSMKLYKLVKIDLLLSNCLIGKHTKLTHGSQYYHCIYIIKYLIKELTEYHC